MLSQKCWHQEAHQRGFSASVFYTTYMVYAPYLQGQTDMRRCMQLKVLIHIHINHTHFTFTFVCTSILTLRKIGSFLVHQEKCRNVMSPCKCTTQSVSKSTDIYTVLVWRSDLPTACRYNSKPANWWGPIYLHLHQIQTCWGVSSSDSYGIVAVVVWSHQLMHVVMYS